MHAINPDLLPVHVTMRPFLSEERVSHHVLDGGVNQSLEHEVDILLAGDCRCESNSVHISALNGNSTTHCTKATKVRCVRSNQIECRSGLTYHTQ